MSASNAMVSYQPTTFGELESFCKRITQTAMVPQAYRGKPDDAAVAVMFGNEIGLPPMTSLQFVAVINGRPGVYGDALPGLAMNKGLIRDMREWKEGEPYQDSYTAVCEVTRPNGSVVTQRFSVADAKRAGLWDKAGPWKQYPARMLQWRARGWAIRDAAPNLLFGLTAEELEDIGTAEQPRDPAEARVINPDAPAPGPRAAAEAAMAAAETVEPIEDDAADPLRIAGLDRREAIGVLEWAIQDAATAAEADAILVTYRTFVEGLPQKARDAFGALVAEKITAAAEQTQEGLL
jgi:hypothetical protein